MEYPMYNQQLPSRPWRQIAKEVSIEHDAQRFVELLIELAKALDEQQPRKDLMRPVLPKGVLRHQSGLRAQ
jgi:hypothetical protein